MEGLIANRSSVSYDTNVHYGFFLSHPIHREEGALRCWDAFPASFSTGREWCCHRPGAGQPVSLKRRALLQYFQDCESSESPIRPSAPGSQTIFMTVSQIREGQDSPGRTSGGLCTSHQHLRNMSLTTG